MAHHYSVDRFDVTTLVNFGVGGAYEQAVEHVNQKVGSHGRLVELVSVGDQVSGVDQIKVSFVAVIEDGPAAQTAPAAAATSSSAAH